MEICDDMLEPRSVFEDWLTKADEHELFAKMRALLSVSSSQKGTEEWQKQTSQVLEMAYFEYYETYQQIWVPYLETHADTWDAHPLLVFHHDADLAYWVEIAPFARLAIAWYKWFFVDSETGRFKNEENATTLRWIEMFKNKEGDPGAKAIASSPYLSKVAKVSLNINAITDVGAVALFSSSHLCSLKVLELKHNLISLSTIRELKKSAALENLERLNLCSNTIGDHFVQVLSKTQALPKLKHLDLSDNPISDSCATAFLDSPLAKQLSSLQIG